jgi:hypothetical protein
LPAVPQSEFRIPHGEKPAAVMELPLGDVWRDTAALYRSTLHGTRVVNGYNGFEPIYYQTLRRALADRDDTVLEALAAFGPILIAADNGVDLEDPWASFASKHPGIRRVNEEGNWTTFWLPLKRRLPQDHCAAKRLDIAAAFDARGPIDAAALSDGNPATRWITDHPQRVGDSLIFDLGRVEQLCGVVVSMGSAAVLYPVDKAAWTTGFVGKVGGSAFRAALENPRDARISLPLGGAAARFVKFRIEQSDRLYPWAVADVVVEGLR